MSFVEHPASVGESYLTHLRHASGFSFSMFRGGLACMVHAIFPFLFTKTASGIVASLYTRMVTNRAAGVSIHRRTTPAAAARRRIHAA